MISLKAKKYLAIVLGTIAFVIWFMYWVESKERTAYRKGVDDTVGLYKKAEQAYLLEKAKKDNEIIQQDFVEKEIIEREVIKTVVEIQKVIEYVDREIEVVVGCEQLATGVVRVRSKATDLINSAARAEGP